MTESTTQKTPKTPSGPKETYNTKLVRGLEKTSGSLVCPKCGSKHRTDLHGNKFCPESHRNCPFL